MNMKNESNDTKQLAGIDPQVEHIELSVSPDYADWGLWEALRELIQNYLDAGGIGREIEYNPSDGVITMVNVGARMSRSALVLGCTDKRNDNSVRGQWGEGMKIAWATLARLDRNVYVWTGTEMWAPSIAASTTFGDTNVLRVAARKMHKANDEIVVEIHYITPGEWEMVRSRILDLQELKPRTFIGGQNGRLLLSPEFKGELFVKGIYVSDLPGKWMWGYDLSSVELDRDRKIASPLSLEPEICRLIRDLTAGGSMQANTIMGLLADETVKEGELFADWWNDQNSGLFHRKVSAAFESKHGATAVPVSDDADAVNAENHGMKAVVTTKALRSVIERDKGLLSARIASLPPARSQTGVADALTAAESQMLGGAFKLVTDAIPWLSRDDLHVTQFVNPHELGDYRDGKITVSRSLLQSQGMLVVVIAHEAACRDARERTIEHRTVKDGIIAHAIDKARGMVRHG